jgi:hypothetical protein
MSEAGDAARGIILIWLVLRDGPLHQGGTYRRQRQQGDGSMQIFLDFSHSDSILCKHSTFAQFLPGG